MLAHLAATWTMVGVIWTIQLVHYPLFSAVGREGFPAYERAHQRRISWLVVPAMLAELGTGIALVWLRPAGVSGREVALGLALLAVVWLSTALWQGPLHPRLARGFDPALHRRLVVSNWLRTAAWSARGLLTLGMAAG